MDIKNNRLVGFIIIALVYALAISASYLVYTIIPFDFWVKLLVADFVGTVVVFVFSVILETASVYDPYWSVQPIVILLAFFIGKPFNFIRLLLLIIVSIWGVRLTANWAYTFTNLTYEDWRYRMLKKKTKQFYPLVNFFGIHLFPTIIVYLCVLPAVFVMEKAVKTNALSIIFLIISLGAILLQGTADYQMQVYRKNRETTFIRTGLWKDCRHPNYLGEIVMWWGVSLASIIALNGYFYLLLGALLNTLMFIFISVPMADNRMSKKKGFDIYKQETRMLIPIKKFK